MSLDLLLRRVPALRGRRPPPDRHDVARRDGVGRDVRPHRRRLRPLLGRPGVAGAALREDALRPGPAAARLRPRRRRAGRAALARRSSPRRSSTCCATCASPAAASPRPRTPTRPAPTATATKASSTRGRLAEVRAVLGDDAADALRLLRHHAERATSRAARSPTASTRGAVGPAAGDRGCPPAPVRGPRAAGPARASTTRSSPSGTR